MSRFNYQLTAWVRHVDEIQFAIDQLRRHKVPYEIKRKGRKLAVFTEGKDLWTSIQQMDLMRIESLKRRRR